VPRPLSHVCRISISAGFAAINVGERLPVSVFHFVGCQEFAQLSTAAGSGECFVQAW
jgi:hypothetical protein